MSSLSNLLAEVRQCQLCRENLPLGPRPVVQADTSARILIVGQAPGRRVHETGIPFNDPSGQRLREWLGIDRETFYDQSRIALLPMGFCYPGTGASGDMPPRPECAPAWRPQLMAHLPNIELTLALGRYAQSYHFPGPNMSVTERAQAWQAYWPDKLALPHPSPRNNMWLRRNPWFEEEVIPLLRQRVAAILERD